MSRSVFPIIAVLAGLSTAAAQAQEQVPKNEQPRTYNCRIETYCQTIGSCEEVSDVFLPLMRLADGGFRLEGIGLTVTGDAPGNFDAPAIHFLDTTQDTQSFMVTMDQDGALVVSGQRINESGKAEVVSAKGLCEAAK